jgi:hypothetical protein
MGISDPWWQPLLGVLSQGPSACASAVPLVTGWDKINSLSTLVVAVFAAVEVWRSRNESRARSRAANAKVSAIAYRLRLMVVGEREGMPWDASSTVHDSVLAINDWLRRFSGGERAYEDRFTELAERAADASPATSRAANKAYVTYYAAAQIAREFMVDGDIHDAPSEARRVQALLTSCADHLAHALTLDLRTVFNALAITGAGGRVTPEKEE